MTLARHVSVRCTSNDANHPYSGKPVTERRLQAQPPADSTSQWDLINRIGAVATAVEATVYRLRAEIGVPRAVQRASILPR